MRPQCSSAAPASGWQPQQREAPSPPQQLAAVVQRAAAAVAMQRAAACDMLCRWVERRERAAAACCHRCSACWLLHGCCCKQCARSASPGHTRLARSSLAARQRLGGTLLCAAAAAAPVPGGGGGGASILADLLSNYVFVVGFCGWFTAQFLKIFTKRYKTGAWDARAFFDSGGMPSSHSSLCSSVTTAIAMQQGLGSPLFAVAVCFRCAAATAAVCGWRLLGAVLACRLPARPLLSAYSQCCSRTTFLPLPSTLLQRDCDVRCDGRAAPRRPAGVPARRLSWCSVGGRAASASAEPAHVRAGCPSTWSAEPLAPCCLAPCPPPGRGAQRGGGGAAGRGAPAERAQAEGGAGTHAAPGERRGQGVLKCE